MVLAFAQPLVRGWARYFTWLQFKRTPRSVIATHEVLPTRVEAKGALARRDYWSEEAKDRHHLLSAILAQLEQEGWRYSTDTGWNDWDIHIYGNFFWSIALQTVTEYHGGPKCLTRVALWIRPVATTVIINLVIFALLIYRVLNAGSAEAWLFIIYAMFLGVLWSRARMLKARVGELVDLAAHRAGLQRMAKTRVAAAPSLTKPVVIGEAR
jgi:hypothetical protein